MPRRFALALCLAFTAPLVACQGTENVTGTPIGTTEPRTLASMTPLIVKSLTVTSSETAFGFPNSRTTTPPIVLVYLVEDGKTVSLGFPDLVQPILFAKLTAKNGVDVTDLPILDK
ncbi:MAG TPA: hypothetical protein VJT85_03260 [Gemmatimonadaceae bacterium]|nr:hypothetical protein [Gemmatimonadaceae bacterium]